MSDDLQGPVVLVSVATDVEAALITGALAEHQIRATATGGYTAGFRAEAPGDIQVVVRKGDLQRAQQVLRDMRSNRSEID